MYKRRALHPGPPLRRLRVVAANVTSWRASAAALATVGPSLALAQARRLSPRPAGAGRAAAARPPGSGRRPGPAEGHRAPSSIP